MWSGKVVVLNGPTSSEKTTVAHALLRQAEAPWLHLGIDALIDGLDTQRLVRFSRRRGCLSRL
jgi:chloramphenicol 3-O-phosphotransferase